jgi:hypothetical protein
MKYHLTNYLCSIVNTNTIEEGYELCPPYTLKTHLARRKYEECSSRVFFENKIEKSYKLCTLYTPKI